MKLIEFADLTDDELFESLDSFQDTGYQTGDLVQVVKAYKNPDWVECKDSTDFMDKIMGRKSA